MSNPATAKEALSAIGCMMNLIGGGDHLRYMTRAIRKKLGEASAQLDSDLAGERGAITLLFQAEDACAAFDKALFNLEFSVGEAHGILSKLLNSPPPE